MSKIKFALVSLSTVAFVLCLALFSGRATSWASPAATPAAQAIGAPDAPSTLPASDDHCKSGGNADDAAQALVPADSRCGKGWVWTTCPCGGAGCRPQNISPANFCGC